MSNQLAGSVCKAVDIAQQVLNDSTACKALTTLGALVVLRLVNRTLSQRTVNNWESVGPWKADRELVLVTGGCSGIGQKIMEDLVKTGVKVVILDIQEPKFKLGNLRSLIPFIFMTFAWYNASGSSVDSSNHILYYRSKCLLLQSGCHFGRQHQSCCQ